jgi:hypothetical protein
MPSPRGTRAGCDGRERLRRTTLRRRTTALSASILLVCAASGCRKEDPQQVAAVRAVILKWHRALLDGNRSECMSCIAGSEEDLRVVEAHYDYVQEALAFKRAVIEAYGQKGWEACQEVPGGRLLLPPEDRDHFADIRVRIKSGYALCELPRGVRHFRVNRVGAVWRIPASAWRFHAGGEEGIGASGPAQANSAYARVLRGYRERIGQSGVTAESLGREVAAALKAAFNGITKAP